MAPATFQATASRVACTFSINAFTSMDPSVAGWFSAPATRLPTCARLRTECPFEAASMPSRRVVVPALEQPPPQGLRREPAFQGQDGASAPAEFRLDSGAGRPPHPVSGAGG